ncbi:MAG: molybdate ABC transporter substrate-binding protein [Salinibacterium sp.]|nr:molybdate ABC transporter substrate-binding protein [Salinibacterium sp.]
MKKRPIALVALIAAMTGIVTTGCAPTAPGPAPSETAAASTLTGTVTVFAAASLTDTFTAIAQAFNERHPDVQLVFNFGGSSGLAAQLVEGAPVDVFAAASGTTMTVVTDAALAAGEPVVFATNTLAIAVPAGNPGGVTGLADFAKPELVIALCEPLVPCGAASVAVLERAGVEASVDTLEQDVRAVLTKIELGEVDAGLVYKTDVIAAGDAVEGIELPGAAAAIGRYPIVQLVDSANLGAANPGAMNPAAAAAFITFVLSPTGQRILKDAGFGAP